MRRLEAMGTYTDDEINRLARGGKQRGHIAGVGRVLLARATASPSTPAHDSTLNSLHKKVDFMMSIFKSESKYSDMFSQFESGGASESGGCGHEEEVFLFYALPHDLAESDNEDLINVDNDGVHKMSADVARSHDGDGGGEDRPLSHHVPRGKGKRKPNLGGRAAGRLNTRDKTRNLSLKDITDTRGPVPIQFELRDKQTVMPLGDRAAHWSSYIE
nr:F-box domain, leucine-rich repeat domain, L domain-like protein [Tanacetum cinerariifolium]